MREARFDFGSGLRATGRVLRAAGSGLRAAGSGLHAAGSEKRAAGSVLRMVRRVLRAVDGQHYGYTMGQHGRIRQIVKDGVAAADIEANDRSTDELRSRARRFAERGIVAADEMSKREVMTQEHIAIMAACYRLLEQIEGKRGSGDDSKSDESLFKAARL